MTGDTTTNEVEADEGAAAGIAERRPSLVKLQSMLKKVSQSPFHNKYKTLVSSSSDSSANESGNKQDGELLGDHLPANDRTDDHWLHTRQNGEQELHHFSPQNGVQSGLDRMNPFYKYYLESGNKGHEMEDVEDKTSGINLDTIFVPPPEFQSSPLDGRTEIETSENGVELSEPEKDIFQAFIPKHPQDHFQTSTFAQDAPTNGFFRDDTMNTPDLSTHTQSFSKTMQLKSSDLFKNEQVDPFQASERKDLLPAESTTGGMPFGTTSSVCENPFTSALKWEDDLFRSPQFTAENLFVTKNEANPVQAAPATSGELFSFRETKQDPHMKEDLFRKSTTDDLDVFSPSSTSAIDPFPSPITRNLFEEVSSLGDPFGVTPSKQRNPFQDLSNGTPDIFQPLPSKTESRDVFDLFPSSTASKVTYTTPSLSSMSAELKLDFDKSPDLFKEMPQESHPAVQPKSLDKPSDIVLTTPQGTKHGILQPTPFTRARNLSMSPSNSPSQAEMDHVQTFKRPPRPLPRTRPPVKQKPPLPPEKPPKPEKPPTPAKNIESERTPPKTLPKPAIKPFPKPVIRRKSPKAPEVQPENYVVFEDILLLGQEKCVEDWPEDSPELQPDFKPSGTLKLRRESLKLKADSDAGSDDESQGKKRDKKFKMSLISRRGSKDKFTDDVKDGRSRTLPSPRKSSKEYSSDVHTSAGESENGDQNDLEYKKKPLKLKVNQLLRRASTSSSITESKQSSRAKDDDLNKKGIGKKDSIRRWSEGTVLNDSTGEEDEAQHEEADASGTKSKKKVKIKFVPHRGFAITVGKKAEDEPKGAHGYTPRKGSKDKFQEEEVLGAHGFTPHKNPQDDDFEDVEELKAQRLQSTSKAAFMDDEDFYKANGDPYEMADCKPKKQTKMKLLHTPRRSSKDDMLDNNSLQKKKSSFSADELDDDNLNGMEDCRPKKTKHKVPKLMQLKSRATSRHSETSGFSQHPPHRASDDACAEDDICQTEEMYDYQQDEAETCKPKKTSKLKAFKKHLAQKKAMDLEYEDPPGATSADYLSEAARAEWLAAQMDERALGGLEDEDEDGDTDSLMEWWNTVEQWDEVPSDEEDKTIQEEGSKSFTILADKVHHGLRVFNKVFTERAEVLWQSIITLHALADDISNFHQKAKIAGITGGTTTAVGGVTAIAGLALAPFTLGASLVITAVGVGVATAGGLTSASAAISDNVNNMHDRKKVEVVLEEYEAHLLDIVKILHFVNHGLYKLRGHPFLRSGTQHYSEDWEIRRAVQMISLVDSPIVRAVDVADTALASVQGLFKGIDKYFIKDSRELKKGCKKEMVAQIKEVATVLNDGVVELNAIREELQDATGCL